MEFKRTDGTDKDFIENCRLLDHIHAKDIGVHMNLRQDADFIIRESIQKVLPDEAVRQALNDKRFDTGDIYVVAAGKAAWEMANTAAAVLQDRITAGVVCTKYSHVKGEIPGVTCFEGGHPVPDSNSFRGTQAALDLVSGLKKEDTVLFLLSGGGSALFEKPLIAEEELADIIYRYGEERWSKRIAQFIVK